MSRRFRILAATIVALGALAGGTVLALLSADTIYRGVRVGSDELSGLHIEGAESRLARRTVEAAKHKVVLKYAGETLNTTIAELGGRMDVRACAQAAYDVGRKGNVFRRIGDVISARRRGVRIPILYAVDEESASRYLTELAKKTDRGPIDARLTVEDDSVKAIPQKPGIELDVERSLPALEQALGSGVRVADLVVATSPPKLTTKDLRGIDSVLGSYSTPYRSWQRDRTHNLKKACSALDGILLKPDEVFSYNKAVGPRLKKLGYRDAPIFVMGEVEPGTGGGVCQVSTTVYNAALLANTKIIERHNHSRPVDYAPVGRDATVAYPSVDLQFKNTTGAPIYIIASVGKKTVDVTFLGRKREDEEVAVVRAGHRVIRAPVVEQVQEDIEPGKRVVVNKGRAGHRISVYRVVKVGGEVAKRELISNDYYKPESRIEGVPKPVEPPPEEIPELEIAPAGIDNSG